MGTQTTRKIPTTLSFIPADPNALPENYLVSPRASGESTAGENPPIVPYEGYNFMPTSYGYKSYFGTTAELDIDSIPARVDEIFIIQTNTFENILVALTESGIWTKKGTEAGQWVQEVVMALPTAGEKLEWSHCVLANQIFCYRQAGAQYYTYNLLDTYKQGFTPNPIVIVPNIPTIVQVTRTIGIIAMPLGLYNIRTAFIDANGIVSPASPERTIILVNSNIGNFTLDSSIPSSVGLTGYRVYIDYDGVDFDGNPTHIGILQEVFFPLDTRNRIDSTIIRDFRQSTSTYNFATIDYTNPIQIDVPAYSFFGVTPTFLNMEGQLGIFKAGSRLAFWDSENAIALGSIDVFNDFTPNIKTKSSIAIFQEITGRIINVLSSGDGFVIYSSKSIISIARDNSTLGFNPTVVVKNTGISFRRECCTGASDLTHFAYTPSGLWQISQGQGQVIVPEVTDFLKESKEPVYLKLIGSRFLFIEMLDDRYANGLVSFRTALTDEAAFRFTVDYFNGVSEGQLEAIDAAILANGDPARVANTVPIPNIRIQYSNMDIARLDNNITFPNASRNLPCPEGLLKTNLDVAVPETPTHITNTYLVTISQVEMQALLDAEYPNSNDLRSLFNSQVLPNATDKTFVGYKTNFNEVLVEQNRLWRERDDDVSTLISRANAGSDEIVLVHNFDYSPAVPLEERSQATILDNSDFFVAPSDSLYYYSGYGITNTAFQDTLISSIDSAWGLPYLESFNNGVRYCRRRTGVASFYTNVSIKNGRTTYFYPKFPGVGYKKKTYKIATGRVVPVLGNTESLGDDVNPFQSSVFFIENYTYAGIDGIIRTISVNFPFPTGFRFTTPEPLFLPSSSFLIQKGGIGPIYPTIPSAYVFDTQLKKWGRIKKDYKLLVDYSPINNTSVDLIDFETFGMQAGILTEAGKIKLFDQFPIDSMLRYGKIGYEREGFSSAEEVKVSFRSPSTGQLISESSLDGATLNSLITKTSSYTGAMQHVFYPSSSARWHTLVFKGNYDIKYIEFRGTTVGNR